ncbi:MAG: zinc ribbon domain-containing protein [Oscillospiraceae bacterium]|jgi:hypothetical protein|nr:zinc ribbon domain-containing protein [Oscillospiraceae bacterium]
MGFIWLLFIYKPNGRYVPWIITEDQFWHAQIERERRSNLDPNNRTRKTARYSSQNVLSGLLVCGDCGRNFRRITRPSGEVVWGEAVEVVEVGADGVAVQMKASQTFGTMEM